MTGDIGGEDANEEEDVNLDEGGWNNLEDAPIEAVHDEAGRVDPDVVETTDGDCVVIPRGVPEPKAPSPEAVARHNLTHLPYASWCPHCVAARRANNSRF